MIILLNLENTQPQPQMESKRIERLPRPRVNSLSELNGNEEFSNKVIGLLFYTEKKSERIGIFK